MMRAILGLALAGLLSAPAGAAAPFNFDCAAALGQNSDIWSDRAGPDYRVSGRLESIDLVRWPYPPGPVMMVGNSIPPTLRGVSVTIGSRSENNYVSLQMFADPAVEDRVEIVVRFANRGESGRSAVMSLPVRADRDVALPFEIVAGAERVIVDVGGRRSRFEVPVGAGGDVRIACEGGRFLFQDMDWDG
jgi:hypothetical protein